MEDELGDGRGERERDVQLSRERLAGQVERERGLVGLRADVGRKPEVAVVGGVGHAARRLARRGRAAHRSVRSHRVSTRGGLAAPGSFTTRTDGLIEARNHGRSSLGRGEWPMQRLPRVTRALPTPETRITPGEAPSYEEGGFLAELRAHARRQEAVAALGALALDEPSLDALAAEAVRRTALALGADLVQLLERNAAGALAVRAEAGPAAGACTPGDEGAPAAHAIAIGDTVVTADAGQDDRLHPPPGAMAAGVSALVRGGSGASGVLCAHWRAPRGVSNDEVHFVESVAHILSSSFARADAEGRARAVQGRLALSERVAAIGTLAGGVAHELNNPLASVAANLVFAEERLGALAAGASAPAAEVLEALRDAREGAERMRAIIRDLQTFSRGDDETPGAVRLGPVLDSCVAMAWSEIRHRARLVKDVAELPPVLGAEGRLAQVFLNFVLNAAQAIAVGAADRNELRIAGRVTPDGRVCVEIRDTGAGIAPEHLPRIFDPFFTTKPLGTGTGLGLSICHGIVTALGGTIEVESELGKGSTFRVLLPPAPPLVALPPARPRVLVVDDDALVGSAVRRALAGDHDVTLATSGRAALALLQAGQTFDAMVSDLLMPDLTGMELHDEVTRLDPELASRTAFMTGGAYTGAAQTFAGRMGDRVVAKPFDLKALRAVVAACIRR